MAISKLIFNGVTQMDVTDTTAINTDVSAGKYFYGADGIKTIGTGSGGGEIEPHENDVTFIDDYTGKIVYAFTADEFANLSAMPANPTHTGMTSQGWNWTLADAKTYVATHGKLWIGQQYVTTSGDTEIDIYLEQGRTSPYLSLAVNGTVSVDWGDDTTPSTVNGTGLSTQIRTLHNYPDTSAPYTIKISVVSGSFSFTGGSTYPVLSKNSSTLNENIVYASAVKFIRIGNNATISSYGLAYLRNLKRVTLPKTAQITSSNTFMQCDSLWYLTLPESISSVIVGTFYFNYSLKGVSIPNSATSLANQAFYNCRDITSISIPGAVTVIKNSGLYGCQSLAKLVLSDTLTSIEASAFSGCYGLKEIHFKSSTPPVVDNSNAFNNLPTDCVIYVPYSADHSILALYRSATNYPDPNTYTYTEESA